MYLLIKKYHDEDEGYNKELPIGVFDSVLSIETYVEECVTNTKNYNSTVEHHNNIVDELDRYVESKLATHSFKYDGPPKKNMKIIQEEYDISKSLLESSIKYKERFDIAKQTLQEATEFNRMVNEAIREVGKNQTILRTQYTKEYLDSIGETDMRKYFYHIGERKVETMDDYIYIEIQMNKPFDHSYGA